MSEGDDSVSFIRRFRSFLGSLNNQSNNDNTKKFIDGFNKTFSLKHSINTAQKFLSGCIMKESQKTYQSQTSLIQCFFAVKTLKDEIATILLNNLKAYVVERSVDGASGSDFANNNILFTEATKVMDLLSGWLLHNSSSLINC